MNNFIIDVVDFFAKLFMSYVPPVFLLSFERVAR